MKKELFVTQSQDVFSQICSILGDNNIKYKTKISDNTGSESAFFAMSFDTSRRSRGTFGEHVKLSKIYYIYVDSKVLNEAEYVINKQKV